MAVYIGMNDMMAQNERTYRKYLVEEATAGHISYEVREERACAFKGCRGMLFSNLSSGRHRGCADPVSAHA